MSSQRGVHLNRRRLLAFAAVAPVSLALHGPANAQTSTPASGERTMTVSVYLLRHDQRRGDLIGTAHREIPVPEGKAVAAASMRQLLEGPTNDEKKAGLTTAIPEGTKLHDVSLDSETKTATVDLSSEFARFEDDGGAHAAEARLAQVVFTLTQFPTIESVDFTVDGKPLTSFGGAGMMVNKPLTRDDFEEVLPLIFVESPAPGDTIKSPVRLWGTANTFEATFFAQVRDGSATVLVEQVVTATSGSGTRGTFDVKLSFTAKETGTGKVIVFERSAKDGSVVNEVEIPVMVRT
jgi:spore germination protein GerM